ncbi:TPA: hypothetical protein ACT9Y1_004279 [Klebsiella pneumoniae]|nr:hypothetical protein [Klebsiella pneumoniae]HDU3540596.1 hypothetical protein [Klebsiella variicola]MDT9907756.1 hypothetical protein [Klebsiella pneumoniae]MDT9951059.1 hypothetical protein [Klebsiella pneumoniae]MDU0036449.1 hypothetical protein [Klebsiella pneumoniae]MDU0063378.1 hypothetical protein [Klebsiella pneumoniae]
MEFWNDEYQNELNSINQWIGDNLTHRQNIPHDINNIDDEMFIDAVIIYTWDYFVDQFNNSRNLFNAYTQFNQHYLKERAIPRLDELKSNKLHFLSNLVRVVYEYYFWTQKSSMPPLFVNTKILERLDKLSPYSDPKAQFIWIERSMPAALTMSMLSSDKFETLRAIANNVSDYEEKFSQQINNGTQKANDKIQQIAENLANLISQANDSQKDISDYVQKLSDYKSEYNFVLLSKAFSRLLTKKRKEYIINNLVVAFFTILLVFIPLMALINHITVWYPVEFNLSAFAYYLPILSLELLMFYFMRLYYIEGKSIKAQILQIDQRLSLCEFIHDYVETKKNSGAEKESWSLFEKLIFSPIQVTSENIPSLLDGASSIAELAGKVLSKDSK